MNDRHQHKPADGQPRSSLDRYEDRETIVKLSPRSIKAINGFVWCVDEAGRGAWYVAQWFVRGVSGAAFGLFGAWLVHRLVASAKMSSLCAVASGAWGWLRSLLCF